jgi:hypothetical protein|tara:strand:- start:669 stop:905 length:237 start_codon:yes stop_codon:yes gene_type:complete
MSKPKMREGDPEYGMTLPAGLTIDRIAHEAMHEDYIGFCVRCGAERYHTEPDARRYRCDECNWNTVWGASELLIILVV